MNCRLSSPGCLDDVVLSAHAASAHAQVRDARRRMIGPFLVTRRTSASSAPECDHRGVCGHRLCELIDMSSCSLAIHRSRGCRPGLAPRTVAPEVFDEVRALVATIAARDERVRDAAVRLAQVVRREALDNRNLVALAHDEDADLGAALAALCVRRR
jgi:hypothetical protein